jgi:hypothetical protein
VRSHAVERAWTVAQGASDRPVCAAKSLSRPHRAINPITSVGERLDQFSQSSPRVKLGHYAGQVHRSEDLLRDIPVLDQGDETQRGLALLTDNLKAERSSEKFRPRDIPRLAGGLALLVGNS